MIIPRFSYSQNLPIRNESKQDSIYKIKLPKGYGFVVPESRFNIALYKMVRETRKDSIIKEQDNVIAKKDSIIKIYEKRRLDDYNEIERWKDEATIANEKYKAQKSKVDNLQKAVKKYKRRFWVTVGGAVAAIGTKIFIFK